MNVKRAVLGCLAMGWSFCAFAQYDYSLNYQTNTINVASNWVGNGTYVVGSNTFLNALLINSGGALSNGLGYIGHQTAGSNNSAIVNGGVWSNRFDLYVGSSGAGNQLIVTNGGAVFSGLGILGNASSSSNNSVLVTGSGSVWSNQFNLSVGYNGAGNSLTIKNGGTVFNGYGYLGVNSSNNGVQISGNGSVWSNRNDLHVGDSGAGNVLTISNGGAVFNDYGYVGYYNSSSSNNVLIAGTGSVWSNRNDLYVGDSGPGNTLTISDGGMVFNSTSDVGVVTGSSNNKVLVSGPGSVWSNVNLFFGGAGAENALTISNGGVLFSGYGTVGGTGSSTNNSVQVSGAGSVWNNLLDLILGLGSPGNALTISNGGAVFDGHGYVGWFDGSSSNSVLVAGSGSVWSNFSGLYIGFSGSANSLTISNSGVVFSGFGFVGSNLPSSNNSVLVTGTGSTWNDSGLLYVGDLGSTNQLSVIDNSSVVASNLVVGNNVSSVGNAVVVSGGGLYVTNALGNAGLDCRRGEVSLNSGTVTTDRLILTSGATSVFTFNGGLLNSGGTFVTNAQQFVVGDGAAVSTFHLLGGVHSFANGLRIRSNSFLTGCGTINGVFIVDPGGTVVADCGGTLTFRNSGTVNGIMHAENGSVLETFGKVDNNGIIDIMDGTTHGLFIDNTGTTVDATYFRVMSIAKERNGVRIGWSTVGGRSYVVQSSSTLAGGFSDLSPSIVIPGTTLSITNYFDIDGATNIPARFYRVRLVP